MTSRALALSKRPRHDEDLREPLVRRQGSQVSLRARLESARAREVTLQTPWVQGEGKGRGGRKGLSRHHRSAEDLPTRAWEPRSSPLSSPSKQVQHLFHFICVSHTQRWTQRQVRHSYALRAHGGQWGEPREQAACPACPMGGRSLATGGAAPWGAQRPGGALGVEPCSTPREEPASHPGKDGAIPADRLDTELLVLSCSTELERA